MRIPLLIPLVVVGSSVTARAAGHGNLRKFEWKHPGCFKARDGDVTEQCAAANAGCCVGYQACADLGPEAEVCPNSCRGFQACKGVQGKVADGSCLGLPVGLPACGDATGDIGAGSCLGMSACYRAGIVGEGSCIDSFACQHVTGGIGDGSCIGFWSCDQAGKIGDSSCIGLFACDRADEVGDISCPGAGSCSRAACVGNSARVESCGWGGTCGC